MITIIVLLILAGVTINSVVGSDRVIKKSKVAVNQYKKSEGEEEVSIKNLENVVDKHEKDSQENFLKSGEYASNTDMYSDGTSLAVIPAGFTVSGMASEKKISSGLVIYKGDLSKANLICSKYGSYREQQIENGYADKVIGISATSHYIYARDNSNYPTGTQ